MKLNVAVIGVGSMGKNHVRVYSSMDNVNLVAVSDTNEENLRYISDKYHIKGYVDYNEMINKEKIDLISIVVPTIIHYQVAIDVINKKINVLLEKPIATTIEEAEEIINIANRRKVKLMIGHIERFNPAIIELKKRIEQVGEIYKINIERIGPYPKRIAGTGVVLDLSVHDIDIVNYLLNKSPKRIYAKTQQVINREHEDSLISILEYDNIIVTINADWLTPTKKRIITIIGSKGMFEVNYLTQDLYFYNNKYEGEYEFLGVEEGDMIKIQINKKEPLYHEMESFIDCIINDTKPPISGEDGLNALSIANGMLESSKHHVNFYI